MEISGTSLVVTDLISSVNQQADKVGTKCDLHHQQDIKPPVRNFFSQFAIGAKAITFIENDKLYAR